MDALKEVKLIEYSKPVDTLNCLTHAFGALCSAAGLAALAIKAVKFTDAAGTAACVIYGLSLTAVYTISAVYHGLPPGEAKRKARLLDHLAIPLLLAGTSTPFAVITLRRIGMFNCLLVLCIAWFCALFGITAKLFFFEKLKAAVMAVYFVGGAVMLFSAVPLLADLDRQAFLIVSAGCLAYTVGALFCHAGIKRPALHIVFHVFTLLGSFLHFAVIYIKVLRFV